MKERRKRRADEMVSMKDYAEYRTEEVERLFEFDDVQDALLFDEWWERKGANLFAAFVNKERP